MFPPSRAVRPHGSLRHLQHECRPCTGDLDAGERCQELLRPGRDWPGVDWCLQQHQRQLFPARSAVRADLQRDRKGTQHGLRRRRDLRAPPPHDGYRRPTGKVSQAVCLQPQSLHVDFVYPPHPEPCPPSGVTASVDCQQLSATVSWEESDLALSYMAYLESPSGHQIHCASTGAQTQCEVTQLMCSMVYDVWVKALGQEYNSSASTVFSLTSGEDNAENNAVRDINRCQIKQGFFFFLPFCCLLLTSIVDTTKQQ